MGYVVSGEGLGDLREEELFNTSAFNISGTLSAGYPWMH